MQRPLIGITARHVNTSEGLPAVRILRAYVTAIVDAGGAPILIPPELPEGCWRVLLDRLDGVLFSGGADIGLEHFDGEPHPTVDVEPVRDALELPLLRAAVDADKPLLGICRGFQVMNVALGGTLYTHILDQLPNALQHDWHDKPRDTLAHSIRVEEGTRLAEILGAPLLQVNSLHHQGIKDLAPSLKATAYSPDGLIEGIELPNHKFALAVQWHPEWMRSHEEMRRLFRMFVEAAK
ncbi:MAG: gamma-glutamyl-gamma-aminobutyrate hydrolase family protein [Anaerolineaceae bacterium]|nr:MAG: gamma-glutamyl-gamma-aminobutyrate hydrolase family protein [Anaerolineaceae bacterium]